MNLKNHNLPLKVILVVGTRPNFIKIAPILAEMDKYPGKFRPILVHTGQHYDANMSGIFFENLNIRKPDICLNVGSSSHAEQTGKIMMRFAKVLLQEKPDMVLVVGDVNSTLACALCAAKMSIPVVHVEAGLRSFDMSMPEEINRRLTDHLSEILFVTEPAGIENLLNEGISKNRMHLVGDVLIDVLIQQKKQIRKSKVLEKLQLKKREYAVLTLHRPSNVDNSTILQCLFETFYEVLKETTIIFPAHPRVRRVLKELNVQKHKHLKIIEPLGYFDFLALEAQSKFILTDSGGVQVEAAFLKVPCLILRENTERQTTLTQGTNVLCGSDKQKILKAVGRVMCNGANDYLVPNLWDGRAAGRIVNILRDYECPAGF
jgi:UDP-N-acetylglucosamine 2-epimerase (non-hydrolysing)